MVRMKTNTRGKRKLWLPVLLLLCCAALAGCKKAEQAVPEEASLPEASPAANSRLQQMNQRELHSTPVSDTLVGFIAPESREFSLQMALHGFLRTAESLGYPAKLYTAAMGTQAEAAVLQAAEEGCKGLLIWNPGAANDAAIARAAEQNIPVVVPYHASGASGARANVVADLSGYAEEAALSVAYRMAERECKAGKILVYGRSPQEAYVLAVEAIAAYYPQYNVAYFAQAAAGEEAAISELAEHILWNRDIKGIFCTDVGGAKIAVQARKKAETVFKAEGPPEGAQATSVPGASPTPKQDSGALVTESGSAEATPAQSPGGQSSAGQSPAGQVSAPQATPVPEGLLKSIVISVVGYGLDEDAIAMMDPARNDIYACVAEPYYESGAQSLMLLDRILRGESVPAQMKLNMPIVRANSLEKFVLIREQVQALFAE